MTDITKEIQAIYTAKFSLATAFRRNTLTETEEAGVRVIHKTLDETITALRLKNARIQALQE